MKNDLDLEFLTNFRNRNKLIAYSTEWMGWKRYKMKHDYFLIEITHLLCDSMRYALAVDKKEMHGYYNVNDFQRDIVSLFTICDLYCDYISQRPKCIAKILCLSPSFKLGIKSISIRDFDTLFAIILYISNEFDIDLKDKLIEHLDNLSSMKLIDLQEGI